MKKVCFLPILLWCWTLQVFGQELPSELQLSELSAKASLQQTIGVTDISLHYYRPNAKGRRIWGELVPFGEVWRAGANNTSKITFSTAIKVEGKELAAGTYSLFVIPEVKQWTFIFNTSPNQFGAFFYTGESDALKVIVPVEKRKNHQESLSYQFDNIHLNKGELRLSWGTKEAILHMETSLDELYQHVLDLVKLADEQQNNTYYTACISWAIDHQHFITEAEQWLAASLAIKPGFGNQLLQCRLWALKKEYDMANHQLEKLGKEYPQFVTIVSSFKSRWEKEQKL
ncbi:MAG: DUF2911 domain-containing protein [Saprospiraceae bacterium]